MNRNSAVAGFFLIMALVTLFFGVLTAHSSFWTGLLGIALFCVFAVFLLPRI